MYSWLLPRFLCLVHCWVIISDLYMTRKLDVSDYLVLVVFIGSVESVRFFLWLSPC